MSCGVSGAVALDVIRCGTEPGGIVAEPTQTIVAIPAEKATDHAGRVIMIDRESLGSSTPKQRLGIAADRAKTILGSDERRKLAFGNLVISPKVTPSDKRPPFVISMARLPVFPSPAAFRDCVIHTGRSASFDQVLDSYIINRRVFKTKQPDGFAPMIKNPNDPRSGDDFVRPTKPNDALLSPRRADKLPSPSRISSFRLGKARRVAPPQCKRGRWIIDEVVAKNRKNITHDNAVCHSGGGIP